MAYPVSGFGFGVSGEWFNSDPEAIISQALQTGAGPNVSDAFTINGYPGPLYNCSSKGNVSINAKIKPFIQCHGSSLTS